MELYYYVYLAVLLSVTMLVIRHIVMKRKNISVRLFAEALKNENNGCFEEAMITYKKALFEVKKTRFHNEFENKIVEKIKVLAMVIEYENNAHFTR